MSNEYKFRTWHCSDCNATGVMKSDFDLFEHVRDDCPEQKKREATPDPDYELILPMLCCKCGKRYGKTNLMLRNMEVWISCDCTPPTTMYMLNLQNVQLRQEYKPVGALRMRKDEKEPSE